MTYRAIRRRRLVAGLLVLGVAVGVGIVRDSGAQQAAYSEAEVKAAFLYHFGTYVEWPTPARADDPVTIAVLGAAAVSDQLAAFLPGRTIDGRPVELRRIARIQDLGGADVLFIGSEHNTRLAQLIEAVRRQPVLLVTDAADGLARGAMVNFQLVDQRLRFEISLPNAEDARLTLSSRLLSAALRVETSSSWLDQHAPRIAPDLTFAITRAPG